MHGRVGPTEEGCTGQRVPAPRPAACRLRLLVPRAGPRNPRRQAGTGPLVVRKRAPAPRLRRERLVAATDRRGRTPTTFSEAGPARSRSRQRTAGSKGKKQGGRRRLQGTTTAPRASVAGRSTQRGTRSRSESRRSKAAVRLGAKVVSTLPRSGPAPQLASPGARQRRRSRSGSRQGPARRHRSRRRARRRRGSSPPRRIPHSLPLHALPRFPRRAGVGQLPARGDDDGAAKAPSQRLLLLRTDQTRLSSELVPRTGLEVPADGCEGAAFACSHRVAGGPREHLRHVGPGPRRWPRRPRRSRQPAAPARFPRPLSRPAVAQPDPSAVDSSATRQPTRTARSDREETRRQEHDERPTGPLACRRGHRGS